jgi:hypothetical protein
MCLMHNTETRARQDQTEMISTRWYAWVQAAPTYIEDHLVC